MMIKIMYVQNFVTLHWIAWYFKDSWIQYIVVCKENKGHLGNKFHTDIFGVNVCDKKTKHKH